jgi:hypothetical protein
MTVVAVLNYRLLASPSHSGNTGFIPNFEKKFMNELVEKLKSEAGLSDEQAKKALETIKTYVVDKFPMLEGAIENLFGGG